jgi:hypothetical protein
VQTARRCPTRLEFARPEDGAMEIAAAVLISSVVLWIVEEAIDEHV